MSVALAVINDRRIVELERGMVYDFAAKSFSSAQEILDSGVSVRARLMNAPAPKPVALRPRAPAIARPLPSAVDYAPLNMLTPCSWRFLVALSAQRHGQHVSDILSETRVRTVLPARHEAVYLIAKHTTHSLSHIGKLMGRDHTTIINSLKHFPLFKREHVTPFAASPAIVVETVAKPKPKRRRKRLAHADFHPKSKYHWGGAANG
ncbi:MAG TPA: helix-turn-helix domain-containing protein [Devosia sp.]|nr:helix-turn-helix domain-containing protein [Devosia sp.]